MAKTKISEFSSTPANNTDIDSINIAEGCAPSGINDAIRELMAQLKDFQTGAQGDSFNGPIGTSTAAAGAFTTLSATGAITSTLATGTAPLVIASTTKVANLNVDLLDGADWASPAALGSTTPAAVSATTLSASSTVTLSGGTANGVAYLNGSKVVTSGSALTFDGTTLTSGASGTTAKLTLKGGNQTSMSIRSSAGTGGFLLGRGFASDDANTFFLYDLATSQNRFYIDTTPNIFQYATAFAWVNAANSTEYMRLTSTGLGIGTSSPTTKAQITKAALTGFVSRTAATLTLENSGDTELYFASGNANVGQLRFGDDGGNFRGAISYDHLSDGFLFYTAGTEGMRLTSTGLGIGTSSPTNTLSVTGSANITGNTTLGDASTDTVTVNGYMGVGGAAGASTAITVAPTALTGTLQYGVSAQPTGTSAATNSIIAFDAYAQVANSAFTVSNVYGLSIRSGSKGASATATNWHGIQIADQTQGTNNYGITSLVSSGTNKWNIYASGTAANYFAGNVQFAAGSAAAPALTRFGDDNTGIFFPAADTIAFAEGGVEAMRIDSSANLGLGVTPSAWSTAQRAIQLASNGSVAGSATYPISLSSNAVATSNGWAANYIADGFATLYAHSAGQHRWFTAPSGTAGTAISFTQAMTLTDAGNLLVGTTSLIGSGRLSISYTSASNQGIALNEVSGTSGAIAIRFYSASTQVGTITTTTTSTSYNTSSDYRLKNTIAPMTGALAKVALLKPCTYKWNADGSDGEGFIAHELAEVMPHAVTGEKDAVDENGNPKYQGIDTSFLVATLTAAIQELKAEFDAYKASHP